MRTSGEGKTMLSMDEIIEKIDVTRYSVTKMVLVPIVIFLIAISALGYMHFSTGSPVKLGMDFTGGTVVKLKVVESEDVIREKLAQFPLESVSKFEEEGGVSGVMLIFGPMSKEEKERLNETLHREFGGAFEVPSDISGVVGERYLEQAVNAVLIAFLAMAFVVFIVFRTPVPSIAVILSALSDIVIATACMNLVSIELSLGTVAALLMLIGYSVDSDILLTMKVIRGRGELNDRVRSAMKTGLTMTSTTIGAVFAMFFVSTLLPLLWRGFPTIEMLRDISVVLLFGLTVDLMNTWMMNAGILRWYVMRIETKKAAKYMASAPAATSSALSGHTAGSTAQSAGRQKNVKRRKKRRR